MIFPGPDRLPAAASRTKNYPVPFTQPPAGIKNYKGKTLMFNECIVEM